MQKPIKPKPERPLFVKMGLWGVKSRQVAVVFLRLCALGAVALAVFGIWRFAFMLAGASLWYAYAVSWVDKNEGWN